MAKLWHIYHTVCFTTSPRPAILTTHLDTALPCLNVKGSYFIWEMSPQYISGCRSNSNSPKLLSISAAGPSKVWLPFTSSEHVVLLFPQPAHAEAILSSPSLETWYQNVRSRGLHSNCSVFYKLISAKREKGCAWKGERTFTGVWWKNWNNHYDHYGFFFHNVIRTWQNNKTVLSVLNYYFMDGCFKLGNALTHHHEEDRVKYIFLLMWMR